MKEVFVFSDWTSVSQIKNSVDPDLKVDCTAIIQYCGEGNEITGYDLTVYLKSPYIILYKVKVETSLDHVWSLNTNEAVEFLNSLGFYCKYELPPYFGDLSDKQITTLSSLKNLGYTHLVRSFSHGRGSVVAVKFDDPSGQIYSLDKTENYNYVNWIFLPLGRPQKIDGILEGNLINTHVEFDCPCQEG